MSGSENSEQEHVRHFLHKTCNQDVSGSFTLQSCKKRRRNVQKKCVALAKLFFFRPIAVFLQFSLSSPLKVMLHVIMMIRNDDF